MLAWCVFILFQHTNCYHFFRYFCFDFSSNEVLIDNSQISEKNSKATRNEITTNEYPVHGEMKNKSMSPKPKAPLRRTNGAMLTNRENRKEVTKLSNCHLQNKNNIDQHDVTGPQNERETMTHNYIETAQKSNLIEIEIEDEDRFLPSNLLADSNSGYIKDQDSIQKQKVFNML